MPTAEAPFLRLKGSSDVLAGPLGWTPEPPTSVGSCCFGTANLGGILLPIADVLVAPGELSESRWLFGFGERPRAQRRDS